MIYLEKSNVLFLKPFKVAGTSFEIALSKFATSQDIVTELHAFDSLRAEFGYQGPVNFKWCINEIFSMRRNAILKLLYYKQNRRKFKQHTNAIEARERLGSTKFDDAFKVSIIRNPFDYLVSYFFWGREIDPSSAPLETWLYENPRALTRNEQFYFIEQRDVIDFYLRYEYFGEDIAYLEQQKPELSGLSDAFLRVNANSGSRPKDRSVDEYFAFKNELIDTVLFFQGHHIQRFSHCIPQRR